MLNEHLYPPSVATDHIGIPNVNIREKRNRGDLEGVGARQPNGRWLFSAIEITRLGIAGSLSNAGLPFGIGLNISKHIHPGVFHYWGWSVSPAPKRYAIFWPRFDPKWGATPINDYYHWDRFDDFEEVQNGLFSSGILFDAKHFAETRHSLSEKFRSDEAEND